MLLVMVWLLSCLLGASKLPEPTVQLSHIPYLSHRSSGLGPPIPVALVLHTPLPSARFFILDPSAKDHMHDKDVIPDLLTDEGPSTG